MMNELVGRWLAPAEKRAGAYDSPYERKSHRASHSGGGVGKADGEGVT